VPANVIDVMIALSYPQNFAVNLAQADGQVIPTGRTQTNAQEALRDGPTVYMNWDPLYSDSYGYYSRYGYRGGLGYSGFYPGYWYQGTPVIITRPSGSVDVPDSETRGRMVKGRGYTRPSSDGGSSSGSPRGSASGGSGSSGSSGGSTSSGGSSSGGSSSGSEPRTAKPKP
jgi:hypothetical protein